MDSSTTDSGEDAFEVASGEEDSEPEVEAGEDEISGDEEEISGEENSVADSGEESDAFESVDSTPDSEEPALEGSLPRHVELSADAIISFLDKMAQSEEWGRELLWLARSILRANLDLSIVGRETYGNKKDKTAAASNKRLENRLNYIKKIQGDAPFEFARGFSEFDSCLERVLSLYEVIMAESSLDLSRDWHGFWADVIIFFKANSIRNTLCQALVLNIGPNLVRTLRRFPAVAAQVCKGFMVVAVYSNPRSIATFMGAFFLNEASANPSRKLRDCVGQCLRTIIAAGARLGTTELSGTRLDLLRQWSEILSVVLIQLQAAGYEREVYERCYFGIQGIVLQIGAMLNKESHMKPTNKEAKSLEDIRRWVRSWYVLLLIHAITGAITLEEDAQGPHALKKLSEGLGVVLLTLIKAHASNLTYRPLVAHYFLLSVELMRATKYFVPLGIVIMQYLMDVSVHVTSRKFRKAAAAVTEIVKPIELSNVLRLNDVHINNPQTYDRLMEEVVNILHDYLALIGRHPAFPEVAHIVVAHLKKLNRIPAVADKYKKLIASIEATAKQIEFARADLDPKTVPQNLFVFDDKTSAAFDIIKSSKKRPPRAHPYQVSN